MWLLQNPHPESRERPCPSQELSLVIPPAPPPPPPPQAQTRAVTTPRTTLLRNPGLPSTRHSVQPHPQTHTLGDRGVPHWEVEGTGPRLPVSRKRGPHRPRGTRTEPSLPASACPAVRGNRDSTLVAPRLGGGPSVPGRTVLGVHTEQCCMSPSTLTDRAKGAVPSEEWTLHLTSDGLTQASDQLLQVDGHGHVPPAPRT